MARDQPLPAELSPLGPAYAALFQRARAILEEDARVVALLLAGSLGRGRADRFSDLDLLVLVADEAFDAFRTEAAALVERVTPTVICRTIPAGPLQLVTAVTPEWLRLDLVIEAASAAAARPRPPCVTVFDRTGCTAELTMRDDPPLDPGPRLSHWIEEFWRVLGLLPVVLGRGELAVAVEGAGLLRSLLIQLLLAENNAPQQSGTKRLNERLTPDQRHLLEALPPLEATRDSLLTTHTALAQAFLPRARTLAQHHNLPWPTPLDQATRTHLKQTLSLTLD